MKKICIAGGGPAGVVAAIFASENPENKILSPVLSSDKKIYKE